MASHNTSGKSHLLPPVSASYDPVGHSRSALPGCLIGPFPPPIPPPNGSTNQALIAGFQQWLQSQDRSEHSRRSYVSTLEKFSAFINGDSLLEVERSAITQYMAYLRRCGNSSHTVDLRVAALKKFYKLLQAQELIDRSPVDRIRPKRKPQKLPRTLTEKQVATLVVKGPTNLRDRAIIEFLYASGCRVAELVAVKVPDLDWLDDSVLLQGKNKKERITPVGSKAVKALKEYLAGRTEARYVKPETGYLFRPDAQPPQKPSVHMYVECAEYHDNGDGTFKRVMCNRHLGLLRRVPKEIKERLQALNLQPRPIPDKSMTTRQVRNVLRQAGCRAGLGPVNPHMLRHSIATHLHDRGVDIRYIQELLGHALVSTTQIYTHTSMAHLDEVMKRCHPRFK